METHEIAILLEDIRGKFDLVLEGHEGLHRRIDRFHQDLGRKIETNTWMIGVLNDKIDAVRNDLCGKIDGVRNDLCEKIGGVRNALCGKIDAVAADLTAHRRDTETHRAVYEVGEEKAETDHDV